MTHPRQPKPGLEAHYFPPINIPRPHQPSFIDSSQQSSFPKVCFPTSKNKSIFIRDWRENLGLVWPPMVPNGFQWFPNSSKLSETFPNFPKRCYCWSTFSFETRTRIAHTTHTHTACTACAARTLQATLEWNAANHREGTLQ